jgi:hypothetical protein
MTILCCHCSKKVKVPIPPTKSVAPTPAPVQATAPSHSREGNDVRKAPVLENLPRPAELDHLYDLDDGTPEVVSPLPRLTPPPIEAESDKPKPTKKIRKKKKQTGAVGLEGAEALSFGGIVLGIGAVAVGAAYVVPSLRVVVALLMLLAGGILAWIGNTAFATAAREEGIHHYYMCRFVPLYKWYFLLTRWESMRDCIAIYMIGCVMLLPGYWVWSITPDPANDGKKPAATSKPGETKAAPKAAPLFGEGEGSFDEG